MTPQNIHFDYFLSVIYCYYLQRLIIITYDLTLLFVTLPIIIYIIFLL